MEQLPRGGNKTLKRLYELEAGINIYDIPMPGIDGIEAIRQLKPLTEYSVCKIYGL